MTLEQLEYALAIQQHGSFSKAAEQSFVTQPALTIQIRNLEQETGIILFDRSRKPVLLTEEGKMFLEKARQIILSVKELRQLSEQLRHTFEGEVRLGVILTLAPYLLPLFVQQLHQENPGIHLQVVELTTEDIIMRLKNGELDAGIVATPVHTKGINTEVLFYERFYFYVAREHPLYAQAEVSIADIPPEDIWLLSEGNCFRSQVNDICNIGGQALHPRSFSYVSNSIESLKRIVEHQGGITLVPELATLNIETAKEKMIKAIAGRQPVREISLITNRTYVKQKLLLKIKEAIWQNIPAPMRQSAGKMVIDTSIHI